MRVGLTAMLVLCCACAGSPVQTRPTSDAWAHYQASGLSFDHPVLWKERPQQLLGGSFFGAIALFSTRRPDQDLCYQKSLPDGGTQEGCDTQRLGKLAPGDVVLPVGSGGMPGQNPLPAGVPLVVDGHDATLSLADQECAAIGADSTVTVTVNWPLGPNYISFRACGLKVPDLEQTMRRLAATTHLPPLTR